MDKTKNTRIVSRNDTSSNWNTANPLLLKGEIGIEIDTNKIKIGDGVKQWQELDYFGGDKKFEAQRNKALNSIEGKKTVTKTELQNILYKYISKINA